MRGNTLKTVVSPILPLLVLAAAVVASWAGAQEITIERPGERDFVRDFANLLTLEDETTIRETCDALLTDQAIPIIVVTIDRMANYGGAGMRIETFAMLLFNQWEIGIEEINGEYWNRGILFLVARDDRVARIELGDGWGRAADPDAIRIMDEQIIPRFRSGEFSQGITQGVLALDKLARGEELPSKPVSRSSLILTAVMIGLAIFTIVSLIRRGSGGWAWLFWAAVFGIIGYMLYNAARSRGGGFSGGSFGGGFSGGGGATGSW